MAKRRSKTPSRSRTKSRTTRTSHAPRGRSGGSDVLPFVLIGAGTLAIGGAIWMASRTAQAAPLPAPSPMPTGGTTPPTTQLPSQPAAPSTSTTDGVTTHTADAMSRIVSRLRTSAIARQIYAFQASLYSYAFTNALPDGVAGPVTTGLIRDVQRLAGLPQTGNFTSSLLSAIQPAMAAWPENPGSLRVVPDRLPADVLNLVNATLRQYAPTSPLLQMYAA